MESTNLKQKSLLAVLREMEVGDSHVFPASKASYVKSACSQFGFEWGKKFVTKNNRKERTVTATRTA